jgi:hypothetical protein
MEQDEEGNRVDMAVVAQSDQAMPADLVHPQLELQSGRLTGYYGVIATVGATFMANRLSAAMRRSRLAASLTAVGKQNAVSRAGCRQRQSPAAPIIRIGIVGEAGWTPLQSVGTAGYVIRAGRPDPLFPLQKGGAVEQNALEGTKRGVGRTLGRGARADGKRIQDLGARMMIYVAAPNRPARPHELAERFKEKRIAIADAPKPRGQKLVRQRLGMVGEQPSWDMDQGTPSLLPNSYRIRVTSTGSQRDGTGSVRLLGKDAAGRSQAPEGPVPLRQCLVLDLFDDRRVDPWLSCGDGERGGLIEQVSRLSQEAGAFAVDDVGQQQG